MRAIDELRNGDSRRQVSIALTGDGPKERKILRAMAGRYPQPNDKLLWIPEAPSIYERGNRRTQRYCGFTALQPVKMFIGKFRIYSYLVLLDYEYVNPVTGLDYQIGERMRENGFNPSNIQKMASQAFKISCNDAAHEFDIYLVISGNNRRIEENEATLINLNYGTNIKPEKNVIANFYRENGISLPELIRTTSKRNIGIAFADLLAALDNIENSN